MTASLKVTSVAEVVEVQSEVAPVNTTDATTGQSLSNATITSLPLATTEFSAVAFDSPQALLRT